MPPVFPGRRFRRRGEQLRPTWAATTGRSPSWSGCCARRPPRSQTWDTPDRVRLQGVLLEAFAAAGAPRRRPSSATLVQLERPDRMAPTPDGRAGTSAAVPTRWENRTRDARLDLMLVEMHDHRGSAGSASGRA